MGIRYEDDCCDCAVPGYPCTGEHKQVPHYYCDGEDCGEEFYPSELYHYEDQMLCINCLAKQFQKVGI